MSLKRVDHDGLVKDYVAAVKQINGIKQHLRQGFFMHTAYENPTHIPLTPHDVVRLKKVVLKVQRRERNLAKMLHVF